MSSKRRMREERQAQAMARINSEEHGPGVIVEHGRAVPYCGCGAREGYTFVLDFHNGGAWVCARCGYPSKGWWEAQQKGNVTSQLERELKSMCAKYRKARDKSNAQPKDQVLLNKKNTARGIIRGLATAMAVWMNPHQAADLDEVMEIERTYINGGI